MHTVAFDCAALMIISFVLYMYWSLKQTYLFFEKLDIPYITPNLLLGNMTDVVLLRKSLAEVYVDLYRQLEPHKFGGVFTPMKPVVIIRDPELLKDVLIKNFALTNDRGFHIDSQVEPLSHNLFTMKGEEWKNLRIKLTGTFSSLKMKMMFPLVKACGEKLDKVLAQIPPNKAFDIKEISARYTTDVIGTCAFGLEINSLENPNSEFRLIGKKAFQFRFKALIRTLWMTMPTQLIQLFNLTFFDSKVQNFFSSLVYKTIQHREENNVTRDDFLDLLIALKTNTASQLLHDTKDGEDLKTFLDQVGDKGVKKDIKMTDELIAAQAFLFFAAGFETSSTTLSYALLELALNQTIQHEVRQEIHRVFSTTDEHLSYEMLAQMPYTDMVISETLRKYPPSSLLFRKTCRNYKIPNTRITLPEDTSVIIPVYGLHLDEKYYPNPQEFRPERFTEEEKNKRPNYTYLPFGEGPRTCIARRFAKMSIKIGLIYALKNASYTVSPKMKFPVQFQINFGLLTARNKIWLQRQPI